MILKLRSVEVRANSAVSGHHRFPEFYGAGHVNDRPCLVMGERLDAIACIAHCRALGYFAVMLNRAAASFSYLEFGWQVFLIGPWVDVHHIQSKTLLRMYEDIFKTIAN